MLNQLFFLFLNCWEKLIKGFSMFVLSKQWQNARFIVLQFCAHYTGQFGYGI